VPRRGVAKSKEFHMVDEEEKMPERVRGRPFPKGAVGNPAGRRLDAGVCQASRIFDVVATAALVLARPST
jgi:hypothetical protein